MPQITVNTKRPWTSSDQDAARYMRLGKKMIIDHFLEKESSQDPKMRDMDILAQIAVNIQLTMCLARLTISVTDIE